MSPSWWGQSSNAVGDLFSAAAPYILPLIGFGVLYGIVVSLGLAIALLIEFGLGIGLSTIAKSLSAVEASYWISSIVSNTITAPILALAVSVLYFELGGSPGRPRT